MRVFMCCLLTCLSNVILVVAFTIHKSMCFNVLYCSYMLNIIYKHNYTCVWRIIKLYDKTTYIVVGCLCICV